MADGLYQSVLVFWSAWLLFSPANFQTSNGLGIEDVRRMGVYVAAVVVLVVNLYVLFNIYRWDWLTLLVVAISFLLFYFWTGVWTASTAAEYFYGAAAQVFAQPSFWALLLVTSIMCLLPRFTYRSTQKIFFPRDVDIIREQVRQGKFDYLKDSPVEELFPRRPDKLGTMDSASDTSQVPGMPQMAERDRGHRRDQSFAPTESESTRPIYPPSNAPTHGRMTGSDATEYSTPTVPHARSPTPNTRLSTDMARISTHISPRPSVERNRSSFDRARASMDRMRPSFEQSDHFTSAAMLTRLESSGSALKYSRERGSTIGEEA